MLLTCVIGRIIGFIRDAIYAYEVYPTSKKNHKYESEGYQKQRCTTKTPLYSDKIRITADMSIRCSYHFKHINNDACYKQNHINVHMRLGNPFSILILGGQFNAEHSIKSWLQIRPVSPKLDDDIRMPLQE